MEKNTENKKILTIFGHSDLSQDTPLQHIETTLGSEAVVVGIDGEGVAIRFAASAEHELQHVVKKLPAASIVKEKARGPSDVNAHPVMSAMG